MKEKSLRKSKLAPIEQLKSITPVLPENSMKNLCDESSGLMYLSGDQMKSMFLKDKKQKQMVLKNRKTRDISYLKDKLKNKSSAPLLLPTNILHLKAMVTSPTSTGLLSHHKSLPMVCTHRECIDRLISSPLPEEKKPSLFSMTLSPDPAPIERGYLGNPSGLQDIESLSEWFKLMKSNCKSDEESEIIYDICSKELLRQVTVYSTLRGKLLKEILHKQPQIYGKKVEKVEQEFLSFKKSQKKTIKALNEEAKKRELGLEGKIEDLELKLAKSEELRKTVDESLLNYRLGFLNLQRKCFEAEMIWRKKAERYLRELNRIKGAVYVGTDKIAKFFLREDLKGIRLDKDLLELSEICKSKGKENDEFDEEFNECQEEILALFQKFLDTEEGKNDEELKQGKNKDAACELVITESPDVRDLELAPRENHKEPNNLDSSPKENQESLKTPEKIFQTENSEPAPAPLHHLLLETKPHSIEVKHDEISPLSRFSSSISESNNESDYPPNPLQSNPSLPPNPSPGILTLHQVLQGHQGHQGHAGHAGHQGHQGQHNYFRHSSSLTKLHSFKEEDEEYIKVSEEHSPLDQQYSVEQHYNFNEEDDSSGFELFSLVKTQVEQGKSNEFGINEAASNLEESRLSNIDGSKYDNPLEVITMNESTQMATISTQTEEQNQLWLYEKRYEKIEEILNKASSNEAQLAIHAIQQIIQVHREKIETIDDIPRRTEILKSAKAEKVDPNTSLHEPITMAILETPVKLNGVSRSQVELENVKVTLLELVNSAGELAAKCQVQKEEIERLDEQLEIKSSVLEKLCQPKLFKKHSKRQEKKESEDKKFGLNKKLTLQVETEGNSWNDGYESGFEEGKIQSYLWLIEKLKGVNPKYSEMIMSQVLMKSNPDSFTTVKRKTTKLSTRFSEFNFHVPVRQQERKKTNTGTGLLEKFLSSPLHKIKTKSTVSRKNVNKTLISIYNQAHTRMATEGPASIIDVTYDEFVSRYATKAASEKKFLEFVASVVANSEFKRCCMYIRLINYGQVIGSGNFSKYSVNFYISVAHSLYNSKVGIFIGSDDEDKIMIPTIRVFECLKEKFEHFNEKNLVQEILGKIEKLSQPDPKKINAGGVIDMELVLEMVIERYEDYVQGILKGLSVCLKALGYESIAVVSCVDFQMILRFFSKTCKEVSKDLQFDDLIGFCIRFNLCHEDEIYRYFNLDSVDEISDLFNKDFLVVKDLADKLREDEKKTPGFELFVERLKLYESLSIEEPELALIGLSFYKCEVERMINETKKA